MVKNVKYDTTYNTPTPYDPSLHTCKLTYSFFLLIRSLNLFRASELKCLECTMSSYAYAGASSVQKPLTPIG